MQHGCLSNGHCHRHVPHAVNFTATQRAYRPSIELRESVVVQVATESLCNVSWRRAFSNQHLRSACRQNTGSMQASTHMSQAMRSEGPPARKRPAVTDSVWDSYMQHHPFSNAHDAQDCASWPLPWVSPLARFSVSEIGKRGHGNLPWARLQPLATR